MFIINSPLDFQSPFSVLTCIVLIYFHSAKMFTIHLFFVIQAHVPGQLQMFFVFHPPVLRVFVVAHDFVKSPRSSDEKEETAGGHEARQRQHLEVLQRREASEASAVKPRCDFTGLGAQERGKRGHHGIANMMENGDLTKI